MTKIIFTKFRWIGIMVLPVVALFVYHSVSANSVATTSISGKIIDGQGLPVEEAEVLLKVNGVEEPEFLTESNNDGVFLLDIPTETVNSLDIEITHPNPNYHLMWLNFRSR